MKRNRVHWRFLGLLFTRLRPSYLALTRILTTVISIAALSVMGLHTPWAQSLSETLFQMPTQVLFNRGAETGLAGYEDGGGLMSVLSNEFTLAKDPTWWSLDYPYAKDITLTNLSTVSIATSSAQITLNTKALFDAGKIQNDCDDLRVVYNQTPTSHTELPRSYHVASGASSCADSTVTTLTFPLREPLESGASTSVYRIYYSNPSVAAPTGTGYDLYRADDTIVQATLVCPFNGTTTCINQSGTVNPTTATGAIRYSGGSALRFDGINDEILFDATSTLGTTQYTVDVWFKVDDINNTYKRILEKDGNKMMFYVYGSTITFTQQRHTVPQSVGQVSATGVQANTWHRVTVVRNGTNFKIFLDGILKQSTTGADYVGLAGNYRFGYTWGSNSAPISLDEFRLSNIARYSTSFDSYATPFEPDPNTVLLWHFDENGDDPRNIGKAIDSSGNGNHGTITGAKYVSGLVGVDNSSSTTGAIPASTYASHQGVFIEEGTTNLITNPSFENTTSATLNWGTNYFNYATASATFTPSMAKRNSAGPFAAGPMVQGNLSNSTVTDQINFSRGNQISGYFYQNMDENQGSVVFWITPEWNGNDNQAHYVYYDQNYDFRYIVKGTNNQLTFFYFQKQVSIDVSTWIAGSTYAVVARWDRDNTLDGTNYLALSVNDSHFFGGTSSLGGFDPQTTISLGSSGSSYPANAIIEGLTIYRRPLFDGQYGIDVGNGDEIAQIYNSGTGKDPTLVTGSWDVVFALPTNASTGTLATGTGNAWSHPHASNLLYTSTTNTGGFMMGGDMGSDGFGSVGASSPADVSSIEFNGSNTDINTGSDASIDNMRNGAMTVEGWYRIDGSGFNSFISKGASYQGWEIIVHQTVGVEVRFWQTDSTTTTVSSGLGNWTADGKWHHIALTYDNNGDKKIRLWIDGVIVGTSGAVTKDQVSDSSRDLRLGNGDYGAVDGSVGWVRISNSVRYSSTFSPASRFSPPTSDANTVAQWNMTDGTGTTVTNVGNCGGVASNCNGTLSNGTWNQGGALSTNQKIFSGGYKFTSNAINQGISRSFTATSGGDYVLRALGHSDGTCNPQVKITRADGSTEISHLNGTTTSTRTDPDVYIFTWESPAAEANQVQLINTASSGTCYWHQVEVQTNLLTNPSMESGSGDPWFPTDWGGGGSGDSSGEIQQGSDAHSGASSLFFNGADTLEGRSLFAIYNQINKYYSIGGFAKKSAGTMYIASYNNEPNLKHQSSNNTYYLPVTNSNWSHISGVARVNGTIWNSAFAVQSWSSNSTGYYDDLYAFVLGDISLTVTPANQANSTETSGLRVDGADTLTQPITGLSTDRGVIKFKFTPRHSWSTAASFGISDPHIFSLGSGSNWISLWRVNSSNLRLDSNFNGSYYTPQWTNPVLNAGETYDIEISYAINNAISLKVNGNIIAFQAMGNTPFSVVPTQIYWGGYSSGKQYDATISNFIALTPTENTTAPYYKFGSKSVKLVNAGTMPDEYTIAIDPNSTATHTLSAYVYDGTSGNVGGTVASSSAKLVFGGSVVTPTSYTDMGGGWWRLTYSAATTDASLLYGVQAQAGKTIYVDGVQLEAKSYATTYADGSLDTTGKYDWIGTANSSTSTRTSALATKHTDGINGPMGTIAFWHKMTDTWSVAGTWDDYFISAGPVVIRYNPNCTGCSGQFNAGYNQWWGAASTSNGTINTNYADSGKAYFGTKDIWVFTTLTWKQDEFKWYRNNVLVGQDLIFTPQASLISSNIYAGKNLVTSDLRIFNQALTPSEVSALYQQGLVTHSSDAEAVDRYVADGTYTSPVIDLGANGAWGVTPWNSTQTLNDGTVTYFTRTSPDNASWSSWEQVFGSVIASAPRRYMQWKANMVANELKSQTPKVTGMTVAYVEDTTPPVNPADLALGYTSVASASATLVSGNYHNFPQPKFTWSAAEDDAASGQSASGVATYHLLMTTDAGATPSAHMSDPCYVERDSDTRSYIVGTAPAACTLTDNTWYLRLQAKDHSGNISSPVTLFVYKYDGTVPDAPAAISSTSVGYSATNSFTFFWPVAQDRGANASGITHYQYKTGATEGVFSEWQDSNVPGESIITQIGGIQAYQQGQNFFFVRSVDRAGNVSAVTTNVAVAPFYYNADAPTAPQNIVISPATSSNSPAASNVFSVSWDAPETYSGEIAKYYYCVNCTPSATTMTETTSAETVNRMLSTMALATQQGKNTFYLVAEDNNINISTGHGNRNFEAYASAEFYASTIAPGAPSNLTVSDASDRDASVWRLTLAWKAAATGGTPARYDIYRSTTGETYALLGNTSSTAYTDADLAQGTIYYYKVRAVDNAGSNSVFSNVVNLAPEGKYTEPPAAGGDPTVSVGSTTATVEWVTSRATFGTVEYGKSTTYGSATAETVAVTNHMLKLKGLAPGTTYHYRVQSLDDSALVGYDRGSAYTKDYTFTTLTAPLISKVEVNDIGLETAVISWTAASLESAVIEYGETTAYGTQVEVSVGEKAASHSTRLSGLNHSTTYHMRIKGVDIDGNDLVSDDYSFQTIVFPRITAVVLNTDQEESGTTAVLAWASNVPTYGVLEYQIAKVDPEYARTSLRNGSNTNALLNLTQEELAQIPLIPSSAVQKVAQTELAAQHVERIAGLSDGSLYIFTIRGKDKYGNETVSDPIRYVTGADTRPPRISNLVFETPVSGTGAQASAQIIVSWETDEPAFAQVAWGEGNGTEYPRETERSEAPATKHVVVLRDLRPTSSYHLKIIVEDKTGNVAESEDTVVVTPSAQQAAFDIIIRNLEDVFGFLNL